MARKNLRGTPADEEFLLRTIKKQKPPAHVAVIMDGNGRWAAKRGLPRLAGHRAGAGAVRQVIEAARLAGVKYLTLYTFSVENWQRPAKEVKGLMSLFEEMLRRELRELSANEVRIKVIGDLTKLPDSTAKMFSDARARTAANRGLTLIIAVNYSGRAEITAAVKEIITAAVKGKLSIDEINAEMVAAHLFTAGVPDPDLIIRTSGELRLSNFLLWQAAYSEFWVSETLWPDFKRRDFYQAIYDFQHRSRRFGRSTAGRRRGGGGR